MSAQTFLLYFFTWLLVAFTPGPAVLCAMSHANRYGLRHAVVGILGIQLGHFVFFGCIACGLAALLATATQTFTILRYIGAAYLLHLGLRLIISTFRSGAVAQQPVVPPARSSLFLQGFAIQITNPKALLFMSALLPQFIQPQQSLPSQLTVLLATTIVVDVAALYSYAFLAARGTQALRNSTATRWLERIFGATLILFGARLLTTRK